MLRKELTEMVWTNENELRVLNLVLEYLKVKDISVENEENGLKKVTFKVGRLKARKVINEIQKKVSVFATNYEI